MSSATRALLLVAGKDSDLEQRLMVWPDGDAELLLDPQPIDENADLLGSIDVGGANVGGIVDLRGRHGPQAKSGGSLGLFVAQATSGSDMWWGYDGWEYARRAIDDGIGTKAAKAKAKRRARQYFT